MAMAIGLAGCAGPESRHGALASLDGTSWMLARPGGHAGTGAGSATLHFDNGRVSGFDGCNRYASTYQQSNPDRLNIAAGSMAATRMACPPDVEQQAAAFTQALARTRGAVLANGKLVLRDDTGQPLATLNPLPSDLAGSRWTVTSFNNGKQAVVSVAAGSVLSLDFGKEGQLSGSAGCNNFSGRFETTGKLIKLGPIATTRRMCAKPDHVMAQEMQFLSALQSAANWRLDGDRLELRTAQGALALTLSAAGARNGMQP